MHWRKPFPPRRPSVLAELITVMRTSLHPDRVLASPPPAFELPHELPPAEPVIEAEMLTRS